MFLLVMSTRTPPATLHCIRGPSGPSLSTERRVMVSKGLRTTARVNAFVQEESRSVGGRCRVTRSMSATSAARYPPFFASGHVLQDVILH
jgi:hypothetical protein